MKIPDILSNTIPDDEMEDFRKKLAIDNLQRGRILAFTVILFESLLVMVDLISFFLNVDSRFQFHHYLIMYLLMIILNTVYLLFIGRVKNLTNASMRKIQKIEIAMLLYLSLILCWGSVLALMDQWLYGQLISYMLNLSVVSVVYYLDSKKVAIPYAISALILMVGLPFFQHSNDILIGHYVNLTIFIFILWLASRIIYHGYCTNYNSMVQIKHSKRLLEEEIKINQAINNKLAVANRQLERLTLIDELTGIPNRRCFKNYIDMLFERDDIEHALLSVMMIDIDYFKQYNDHYGHDEGDKALIAVAHQILSTAITPIEFAVRWGGEEFLFLGAYETAKKANEIAERIRNGVNELHIPHAFSTISDCITVSIGVCAVKLDRRDDVGKLIEMADKALYVAKNSGRNCVKETS